MRGGLELARGECPVACVEDAGRLMSLLAAADNAALR